MPVVHIRYDGEPDEGVVCDEVVLQNRFDEVADRIAHQMDPTRTELTIMFEQARPVPDLVRYRYVRTGPGAPSRGTVPTGILDPIDGANHPGLLTPLGREPNETDVNPIVLLLESPHHEEITYSLVPIGPAAKSTGRQIDGNRKGLANLIGACLGDRFPLQREFAVIIVNPVAYPTSCRLEPLQPDWRDIVFNHFIALPSIRRSFRCRMRQYAPSVIINACTGRQLKPWQDGLGRQFCPPNRLVARLIDEYLQGEQPPRQFAYRFCKQRRTNNDLMVTLPTAEGYTVEIAHPSGWRGAMPFYVFQQTRPNRPPC